MLFLDVFPAASWPCDRLLQPSSSLWPPVRATDPPCERAAGEYGVPLTVPCAIYDPSEVAPARRCAIHQGSTPPEALDLDLSRVRCCPDILEGEDPLAKMIDVGRGGRGKEEGKL